jgi:hypothetical protein
VTAAARDEVVAYPGGLRARWRWAGSGQSQAVFALTEAGGALTDHGDLAGAEPDDLCRAELRVDAPGGSWTARFASIVFDQPRGLLWDDPGQLVVGYGFHTYGLAARTGELCWSHRSASPLIELLASPRLPHVLVQAEIETFAIRDDGDVSWRIAHSDIVTAAELVGGRLVLTSYAGVVSSIDPVSGRASR